MKDLDKMTGTIRKFAEINHDLDRDDVEFLSICNDIEEESKRMAQNPASFLREVGYSELLVVPDEEFVSNLYKRALGRVADADGLKRYEDALRDKTMSKHEIICAIVFSDEADHNDITVLGDVVKELDVNYLLKYEGEQFIDQMYLWLLGRKADHVGKKTILNAMRDGTGKLALIKGIMDSAEYQGRDIELTGFDALYKKWAPKGKIKKALVQMKRGTPRMIARELSEVRDQAYDSRGDMTAILRRVEHSEIEIAVTRNQTMASAHELAAVRAQAEDSQRKLAVVKAQELETRQELAAARNLAAATARELAAARSQMEDMAQSFSQVLSELREHEKVTADELLEIKKQAAETANEAAAIKCQAAATAQELSIVNTQLITAMAEISKLRVELKAAQSRPALESGSTKESEKETVSVPVVPENTYNAIDYFDFENHFRGSREHIKEVQTIYLPYFKSCKNVLDLGCGRGEFTEMLNDHGVGVTGVDMYAPYIEYMKILNLPAVLDDAIKYLGKQEKVDGIFMGQVVEHISIAQIIEVLGLAYEKLESGAYLIMETPNPMSLAIYTECFYMDPSHQKPVHPRTLQYLAEKAGFEDVEILFTESSRLPFKIPKLEGSELSITQFNEAMERVENLLYGSQDYAIIARKK